MKLSTKGRYGLRAMIDLARYSEKEPVSIGSVAARQEISERYLEQLVALLKKADIFLKLVRNFAIKKDIIIKSGIATAVNITVFLKAYKNALF